MTLDINEVKGFISYRPTDCNGQEKTFVMTQAAVIIYFVPVLILAETCVK